MTATATPKPKKSTRARSAKRKPLRPTLGAVICRWIESRLVHAEGDYFGQPIRLRPWQRALIYEAYELNPNGTRVYNRVLWGLPKGQGKTELAAMIADAELAGPVAFDGWNEDGTPRGRARLSPEIPVAAASFDQADLVFGAAKSMIKNGPLNPFCEVYDTEILLKGKPGRLKRVAAAAGTNDGGKPTFWVADELHEWMGNKERVHLVLTNNRSKRSEAWQLAITTAGWDTQSLLGRLYTLGKRIEAGEAEDSGFLFRWFEADKDWDLTDPKELDEAIKQANPAVGDFLSLESIRNQFRDTPEHEARRYHLNQWTSAPERWLPVGAWDARKKVGRVVMPGERIVLGFDGSYSGDSTGVVGCTMDGYLFVVGAWEKPELSKNDWRVDVGDVEQAVRNACTKYKVLAAGCDPYRWQKSMSALLEEGLPIVEWPSHSAAHMVPACAQVEDAIANGSISHDGDEGLARHVSNAVTKIDHRGRRIVKENKESPRKIDLAVCAVIAFDCHIRYKNSKKPSIYATQDPKVLGDD